MIRTILNWFKKKESIPTKINLLHDEINALDLHDCRNWLKGAVIYKLLAKEYRGEYDSIKIKDSRDEEYYFSMIQRCDELNIKFEDALITLNKQRRKIETKVDSESVIKKKRKTKRRVSKSS
jgi:hypothetical protein